MLKYNVELIGYAQAFVSFIFPKLEGIKEIILFGSASRGEAAKTSDVDLFFNVQKKNKEPHIEQIAKIMLEKFNKSKIAETWFLKGIKNEIKIHAGVLDDWKLKRSVISDGIVLYGKYQKVPEKLNGFVMFNIKPISDIAVRNKIVRELFGREEKGYSNAGVLKELNGKKLSPTSFIVPLEHQQKIIKLLNAEKINYSFFEFWSDQIS